MPEALYLDTSAVLRAALETGSTPEVEQRIRRAQLLVTSRLSLVESARAILRLRLTSAASERRLSDAEREIAAVWARCNLWEMTPAVCELACHVAPGKPLRASTRFISPPSCWRAVESMGWKCSRSTRDYWMRPALHSLGGTLAPDAGRWRNV